MFTKNCYIDMVLKGITEPGAYISADGAKVNTEFKGMVDFVTVDGQKPYNSTNVSNYQDFYPLDYFFSEAISKLGVDKNNNKERGFVFGDGSGTPSINDYTIFGNCITGFTFSKTLEYTYDENGPGLTVCFTITNNNSESITISEIGLVDTARWQTTSSSSNKFYGYTLMEHSVLETPITIPAGGVGQVTYTARMNYPTV